MHGHRVLHGTELDTWGAGRGSFDGVHAHQHLSCRPLSQLRLGRQLFVGFHAQKLPRLRLELLETPPLGRSGFALTFDSTGNQGLCGYLRFELYKLY